MKNLKTYEAFFNLSTGHYIPTDQELINLIDVDQPTIEDLLVDIEDKLPDFHISIDFRAVTENEKSTPVSNISKFEDGNYYYLGNKIKYVKLFIKVYPSMSVLKRLQDKIKNSVIPKDESWYNFVLGEIKLSEDLLTLKQRLKLLGFYDFEMTQNLRQDISNNLYDKWDGDNLPANNKYYGQLVLSISAKKDINI